MQVARRLILRGLSDPVSQGKEYSDIDDDGRWDPSPDDGIYIDDFTKLMCVLSPREEQAMMLRLESLKYREIAGLMDVKIQTVHVLLTRAVVKLRKAIESGAERVHEKRTPKR